MPNQWDTGTEAVAKVSCAFPPHRACPGGLLVWKLTDIEARNLYLPSLSAASGG